MNLFFAVHLSLLPKIDHERLMSLMGTPNPTAKDILVITGLLLKTKIGKNEKGGKCPLLI